MSPQSTHKDTPQAERSTSAARFRQQPAAPAGRGGGAGEKLGAAVALLALLIGVPVLLVLVGGSGPVPTSLPSKEWLTHPLDLATVLNVLLAVVWLAWAFFVVCVVVEVLAARRGGLARPVPLGGPVQKAARVLVGAVMLTGVLAPSAMAAPAPDAGSPHAVSAQVLSGPQGGSQDGSQVGGANASAEPSTQAGDRVGGQGEAGDDAAPRVAKHEITSEEHLTGHKVYTVAAPRNGYHDNLWDIAERHLGDGRRYQEIYQLNKGLVQKDGRKLQLARLIQPGWQLVMPDDATGVPRYSRPASTPVSPGSSGGSSSGDSVSGAGALGATAGALAGSETLAADDGGGVSTGLLGSGLLAATALAALAFERRRRIGSASDAGELEAELRGFASGARATFLDRALRDLAAACRRENRPLPPVYAVELTDETVVLRLAPAAPEPAGAWTAGEDGRSWTRAHIPAEEARSDEISPYPGLVSLGLDGNGADILVDLEAAGGVITLEGDPVVGSEVAAAIALQAGTASWAEGIRVTATGLPSGLESIVHDRVAVVDDLGPAIDECAAEIDRIRADVLTGRVTRRGTVPSRLLVAGRALAEEVTDRLVSLTGPGRQALSVLLAGPHPAASWTLRVDEAGTLRLAALDLTVSANRIGADRLEGLESLFAAARQPDRPDDGGRVAIPRPAVLVDDAQWTTASRRVAVLGRLAVTGAPQGPAAGGAERQDQVVELISYLATHREGVHPNVLSGALWPRGVTSDVYDAAVERARAWLGTDPQGNTYLGEDGSGRLLLSDGVLCDWDVARSLLLRSREASTRADEVDLLRRGLQMVRGEAFNDLPDGRYGWLAHDDFERIVRRVVVDAAHRLAVLCSEDDDPDGAAAAASAGLRADPANQLLWRDLLRARQAASGAIGARQTLDEMGEPLRGIPLEAETEALVEEYLPDTRSAV